jgi:acetoacetyl-CoA synthetase
MTLETGQILWTPSPELCADTNLAHFSAWLKKERGLEFSDYASLHAWSTRDPNAFWLALWAYFEISPDTPPKTACQGDMPGTLWFDGTRVNYAERVLRGELVGDPDRTMFRHASELRSMQDASWSEVASAVRKLATELRRIGIEPGDRIAAYMPNILETVIALLATTAIGAVWTTVAPEFGVQTITDRLAQIAPKLIFVADGYRYGGKDFDRCSEIREIVSVLTSVETVVWLDYLGKTASLPDLGTQIIRWESLFEGPEIAIDDFSYQRVDSQHPLWVLFSSGTTGLPKAITHNHHGILIESCKATSLHSNVKSGDCMFFYATTGWMMWNTLMNAPLLDAIAVLYDGHPSHPDPLRLWQLAEEADVTFFGTSPTVTQIMRNMNIRPCDHFQFERLEAVMMAGSPATPEAFAWMYENVKADIWVTSQSGGTEFCSGILGGLPTAPVKAGLIQAPMLGVDVRVFDEDGHTIMGEPGELVVTAPTPSMPVFLWGDHDFERYKASYFDRWPGIWCHGDSAQINQDGTSQVFGRSDATLNRFGVRIGSAEIYRTVELIDGVADSLVVCVETGDGGFYMPLFVVLEDGIALDGALVSKIRDRLRTERSPRHVPDEIFAAPGVPMTLTGKKMEVPVKKLLSGRRVDEVVSTGAMRDPAIFEWYANFSTAWRNKSLGV